MKIAIYSFGHTASSLPLGYHQALLGHHVDFYLDAHYGNISYAEGTDCVYHDAKGLIGDVPMSACPLLARYLQCLDFHLRYINTLGEAKSQPMLTPLFSVIRKLQIRRICKMLDALNYDVVHLVGRYTETDDIPLYCTFLRTKTVVGLHEVCNHFNPDYDAPSPILSYLFAKNIPLVLYSDNTFRDIQNYKDCNPENISMIHFGNFETFTIYNGELPFDLPEKYILYLGTINPYKGLPVLVDAIHEMQTLPDGWKVVVAGNGKDDCLSRIASDDRYVLINRFLQNGEIAELLRHAVAVVCPYVTMSQSGIPQTAFAFNAPIIASDLDGFKEIIFDGENGLLFKTGNHHALSSVLCKLMNNPQIAIDLREGASHYTEIHPEYSWKHIASQYIELFQRICNR